MMTDNTIGYKDMTKDGLIALLEAYDRCIYCDIRLCEDTIKEIEDSYKGYIEAAKDENTKRGLTDNMKARKGSAEHAIRILKGVAGRMDDLRQQYITEEEE